MAMADVTVYGAGIFGLSIAWACVTRGAMVQVIDPFGPGNGASGGIVGALSPHVPETWNDKKAFQLDSLLMAEDFWAGVLEVGGKDPGYARTGRVQPIADDHALALARARVSSAAELWPATVTWAVRRGCGEHPFAPPSATGWYIHDTLSALIHPRRAVAALVAALDAKGVVIAADGNDQGNVVRATGIEDLAALSKARGRVVGNGVKGQAALLAMDARGAPQVFADALHFVPHTDGTLAIGSTSERDFTDGTTTDHALEDVIARARQCAPALRDARILDRWAGVRPRSRSRAPMLGAHPLYPGAFIANGGFKIGFGMAPKVAAVMADLMLEGADNIPLAFRPEASL